MGFKLRCFGIHLFFSVIVAVFLYLFFLVWYPPPLSEALGVAGIFFLLICIDVILGPMLTFIIAKQDKKTLKMDLFVVVFIQGAALLYGLYIAAQGRPVWIIYDSGRFELVQAYEVIKGDRQVTLPAFRDLSYSGPIWGGVSSGRHLEQGNISPPQDMYLRAEYLSKYEVVANDVVKKAIPLKVLYSFNKENNVDEILQRYPQAGAFVPLQAKERPLVVLINKATADPVAIVNLSPW